MWYMHVLRDYVCVVVKVEVRRIAALVVVRR